MDIGIILKLAGVGVLVWCVCAILNKSGRDEQATLVSVAGIIVVMLLLISELGELFGVMRSVFGI